MQFGVSNSPIQQGGPVDFYWIDFPPYTDITIEILETGGYLTLNTGIGQGNYSFTDNDPPGTYNLWVTDPDGNFLGSASFQMVAVPPPPTGWVPFLSTARMFTVTPGGTPPSNNWVPFLSAAKMLSVIQGGIPPSNNWVLFLTTAKALMVTPGGIPPSNDWVPFLSNRKSISVKIPGGGGGGGGGGGANTTAILVAGGAVILVTAVALVISSKKSS